MISYIKEKDRLLNPELYIDRQPNQNLPRNPNLFDDDCVDDEPEDSNSDSADSSSASMSEDDFPMDESSRQSGPLFDLSHDTSNQPVPENSPTNVVISSATKREKEIDAELEKYRNFNKEEFTKLCMENGLVRSNSKKYESIGSIVWQFWRRNKYKYPIIYECIKCVIQAPTSSSSIEREFSKISAFVTHQKNAFKSKSLLALIQISEMDDFLRIANDCFRQNNVTFSFEPLSEDEVNYRSSHLISDDILFNFD